MARGSLVDEDALIAALKAGKLGMAGLDVFDHEPTPASRWVGVLHTVLTPHTAGATLDSIPAMVGLTVENLRRFFKGEASGLAGGRLGERARGRGEMAKVLGLGGIFFKAEDPAAVREWYARVLGFEVFDWGGAIFKHPKVGVTNWSPFAADTRYFEPSQAPFMVNYIVDDLDGCWPRRPPRALSRPGVRTRTWAGSPG